MPDRDQLPESPRENLGARRLGRAGFLGVVGAGVATLFYGKAISHVDEPRDEPALGRDRPDPDHPVERLADLHRRRLDADVRPRHLAAPHRRARRAAGRALPPTSCSPCPKAEQVSTFHCVTGWIVDNVHWGGVRFHDLLAPARPLPTGRRAALRLGREALRRLPRPAAGVASAT